MKALRLRKEWLWWLLFFGILSLLGRNHFHLKEMSWFLLILAGLSVLLVFAFSTGSRQNPRD